MAGIMHKLVCPQCAAVFELTKTQLNQKLRRKGFRIFCSRGCYIQSKIKLPKTFVCRWCSALIPNDKGYKRRVFCSPECRSQYQIGKPSNNGWRWSAEQREARSGENSNLWRGGKTAELDSLRRSKRYLDWRKAVFERDNFTCQSCGQRGGELQADHELPFAYFPDLRFEVLNGRTLCRPCHKKTPTWGLKAKQLYAWL